MITRGSSSSVFLAPVAAFVIAFLFLAMPAHAQNVQVDLSATSALCGGQECFNMAGIFANGVTFQGTSNIDGTASDGCANGLVCSDAYSAQELGLALTPPPPPPSRTIGGVPFTFGPVNTVDCGKGTNTDCTPDIVQLPAAGAVITLPTAQQVIYSTMVMLGNAVQGSHTGTITLTYTTGAPDVLSQTFSDWCGFGANQYETIAVGGIERINSDGTLNGATCNLYEYTYPVDYTRTLQSITLTNTDGSGYAFAFAITLKPPSFLLTAGVPTPPSVTAGSTSTSTVTVTPQPGYVGTIALSCSITPTIVSSSSATAPTCSLSPTSVTVTADESAPPTTTLTFSTTAQANAMLQRSSRVFYALWLPGLGLVGISLGSRSSRRRRLSGWLLLGLLLAVLISIPACVSVTHLGNVGTPPGQYSVTITGLDAKGLSQAGIPAVVSLNVADK